MWPRRQPIAGQQTERASTFSIRGQRSECALNFGGVDAALKTDRAEVMAMESFGQTPQDGLVGIGSNPFDDQLTPGNAERNLFAFHQQQGRAARDGCSRRLERGMIARIHCMFVQRDRELDEKNTEIT
jgi:hypothetical protein